MPSHPIQIEAVAKDFQKLYVGLTAAGTAPGFPLLADHRIPSSYHQENNPDNKP